MTPNHTYVKILRDIEAFAPVRRYYGMLPFKLAVFHDDPCTEELIRAGLMERVFMDLPCGSENTLFRLTDEGRAYLRQAGVLQEDGDDGAEAEASDEDALTKEQRVLLKDIYHCSRIHRFDGMMPVDMVDSASTRDMNALFRDGYVLKVTSDTGASGKRKGLILSRKGLERLLACDPEAPVLRIFA
jgi:hypothetical protein